jgi:hypothetical protein
MIHGFVCRRVIGRSQRGNIWIIHVSRRPGEPYGRAYGSIWRWSIPHGPKKPQATRSRHPA